MQFPPREHNGLRGCEELITCLGEFSDEAELDWRDFESHCARILEENDYTIRAGVWFRDEERKYQIDVVGVILSRVLCVDCKAWARGGGSSRSRNAAELQRERTAKLKEIVGQKGILMDPSMRFYPMVITLKNEGISLHEGTPIVPFEALNSFLVDLDLIEAELEGI